MGRPRKTERHDDFDGDDDFREVPLREAIRDDDRELDNPMFNDAVESPLYIPKEDWPDGMALRWVSIEAGGAPDSRNWSMKSSAHWVPVARGKYPKLDDRFPSIAMPGQDHTTGGNIVFGGLCLCQRDIRYNIRDRKKQEAATIDAGRTIDSYVEGGNSTIPRFNQSSPVQYERGVRPAQFKE